MIFCEKICNFSMTNWNDGINNAYILKQDKKFWYYILKGRKTNRLGILSKQFIDNVELCKNSEPASFSSEEFSNVTIDSFLNRPVDIFLDDKYIWSGIIGEETEIYDTIIKEFNEEDAMLLWGRKIPLRKIVKIEGDFV